jgi:hypothetical protein
LRSMRFCDVETERKSKEKKTQDPPSQTEGGAPSVWMRGSPAEQAMITDRLCEKKESKGRRANPSLNFTRAQLIESLSHPAGSCQTLLTCVLHESMLSTCRSWFRSGTYRLICIASSRRARRSKACPSRSTCSARYATPSTAPLSMKCESGLQTATPCDHDPRQRRWSAPRGRAADRL